MTLITSIPQHIFWERVFLHGLDLTTLPVPGSTLHVFCVVALTSSTFPCTFQDQLDESDAIDEWLPASLPPHCCLVISTLPASVSPVWSGLARLGVVNTCPTDTSETAAASNVVPVFQLAPNECASIVDAFLARDARRLSEPQFTNLLNACHSCATPLYVNVAYQRTKSWRSFAEPEVFELCCTDCCSCECCKFGPARCSYWSRPWNLLSIDSFLISKNITDQFWFPARLAIYAHQLAVCVQCCAAVVAGAICRAYTNTCEWCCACRPFRN